MLCEIEREQRDQLSPGPVACEERIARGAFAPSAGDARKARISLGIVAKRDLFGDQLSVWRLAGDPPRVRLDELAERLRREEAQRTLFAIVWALAQEIRAIRLMGEKALCVLDECDTDHNGGKHPAHAHIAISPGFRAKFQLTSESSEFQQLVRDLANLLKSASGERRFEVNRC
ncbi:hypothetical protein [Hansschlegelia beijingensis]|uniref:Uncharacterized protein n=1 Tax=Hansschlegelia beijingensis TaxID=1133344 RepID=A0A7W6D1S7_9HYPH|nr:hypothetical protein [Hansschlegelia beijingensis]MBB3972507.1 hypothetical protein [Hansschlegelia beijingensis]